jgi:hypothetical protein
MKFIDETRDSGVIRVIINRNGSPKPASVCTIGKYLHFPDNGS